MSEDLLICEQAIRELPTWPDRRMALYKNAFLLTCNRTFLTRSR
jgi:hypothetical protein